MASSGTECGKSKIALRRCACVRTAWTSVTIFAVIYNAVAATGSLAVWAALVGLVRI
eukprot:COSAG01_NODE_51630_length_353_cov_0.814961_1_plen_56_part_01